MQLNVISELDHDETDPNILIYKLPDHDMQLDFNKKILAANPDSLGQEEPNEVEKIANQMIFTGKNNKNK